MSNTIPPIVLVLCVVLTACATQKTPPESLEAKTPARPPVSAGFHRNDVARGDLDEIVKRRYLRVLIVPDKLTFFFDGSQLQGAAYEAMQEFERTLNRKLNTGKLPINFIYLPVRRNEILQMLADGRGDVAAARLPVTAAGQALVDFSEPTYDKAEAVAVTGPASAPIATLDDVAGKETYQIDSQGARELLAAFNARLRNEGKQEVRVKFADENLDSDDVIEMVNAGLVPMTFAERSIAEMWSQVFDRIKVHQNIVVARGSLAWGVRKGCPQLLAAVNDFVKDHKVGTAFGSTVLRSYLKSNKWIRDAVSAQEAAKFQQMIGLFQKYGDKYDFPHLLLSAQGYQESRLNHELRNPSGAVGVMQIKPTTAASKPIEIPDVTKLDPNIEAGAKYLRFIADHYYRDSPADPINKALFVIASYNAGPAKIRQFRQEAAAQGLDPDRWFNNVEVVASQRIGRETVQYVANIYKYFLAYQMITERMSSRSGATRSSTP